MEINITTKPTGMKEVCCTISLNVTEQNGTQEEHRHEITSWWLINSTIFSAIEYDMPLFLTAR